MKSIYFLLLPLLAVTGCSILQPDDPTRPPKEMVGTWATPVRTVFGSSEFQLSIFPDGRILFFSGNDDVGESQYEAGSFPFPQEEEDEGFGDFMSIVEPRLLEDGLLVGILLPDSGLAFVFGRVSDEPSEKWIGPKPKDGN